MSKPQVVNEADFEAVVLKAQRPVLVDFWATWCGPCQMLAPTLEQFAASNAGKIYVVKIDVDKNQNLAAQYGIRSIPCLLLFKNGQLLGHDLGLKSLRELENFVAEHI